MNTTLKKFILLAIIAVIPASLCTAASKSPYQKIKAMATSAKKEALENLPLCTLFTAMSLPCALYIALNEKNSQQALQIISFALIVGTVLDLDNYLNPDYDCGPTG